MNLDPAVAEAQRINAIWANAFYLSLALGFCLFVAGIFFGLRNKSWKTTLGLFLLAFVTGFWWMPLFFYHT